MRIDVSVTDDRALRIGPSCEHFDTVCGFHEILVGFASNIFSLTETEGPITWKVLCMYDPLH